MSIPKISIVIPLFNKEKFITQSLKSVVDQKYTDWECIIVNDGSTDLSLNLATDFIANNSGSWRIVTQVNSGPSAARNYGLELARGEFVAFLDSDDVWLPTKLEKQLAFMQTNNLDLSVTNYIIFSKNNKLRLKGVRAKNMDLQIQKWTNMRGFGGLVESTGMIRRNRLSEDLKFDQSMLTTEGLDFVIRWNMEYSVSILKEFQTLYRISAGQLHNREDLVSDNVKRVLERYTFLAKDLDSISKSHKNYFLLSKMRNESKFMILRELLFRLFRFDESFFKMAFSIALRNFLSSFLSFRTRRSVTKAISP